MVQYNKDNNLKGQFKFLFLTHTKGINQFFLFHIFCSNESLWCTVEHIRHELSDE